MPEKPNAELALSTEQRLAAISAGYNPDLDFKKLALEATYIHMGYTLVDKEMLSGVPLVVIGVTYREGYPNPKTDLIGDYVSVEAVCGGPADLSRNIRMGLLKEEELRIDPNQLVVFNDGSTGIRRQLTGLLHDKGMINVGPEPEKADGFSNRFDRPYQYWIDGETMAQSVTDKSISFSAEPTGEAIRYVFYNGLRRSDYEYMDRPATTWYFG